MKYLTLLLLFCPFFGLSQNVGIGTTSPDASAKLEVQSTTGGVLIPRLTTTERDDIPAPIANGLLIYNSENTRFEFWNGTAWAPIASASSGGSEITDNDGDTKISVEESADEDTLRFYSDGQQIMKLDNKSLQLDGLGKGTLIGLNAGKMIPNTDHWNSFIGYRSGESTNSGISNTFLGAYSGSEGNKGSANSFIGVLSGEENTGNNNTFLGIQSGQNSAGSSDNTYIGAVTGQQNTGSQNIGIGSFSSYTGSGSNNIGIGRHSLFTLGNGSSALLAIGDSTLQVNGQNASFPFQGIRNTAVGHKTLKLNRTGLNNTALGYHSLESNDSGNGNTAIGANASNKNKTGFSNTAIGAIALFDNIEGVSNTVLGAEAGRFSQGSRNTFIGTLSGSNNLSGSGNIFIGNQAGEHETGSDKLYIANTSSSEPLIYGDFENDSLHLNGVTRINQAYDLPSKDGLLGQVLNTNGAGQLSWSSVDPCETRIPIDSMPFTISEPGSYYITKNLTYLTGSGITIDTNNVTLDLKGFTLYGGAGTIFAAAKNGITINGNNNSIINGVMRGWTNGIYILGDNNEIKNCRLYKSFGGLYVFGTGNLIEHCTISFNSLWGLRLDGSRHVIQYNILDNNNPLAQNSSPQGAPAAVSGFASATFFRNHLSNNGSYGFLITGICLLEENTVENTFGTNGIAYYFTGNGDDGAMLNNKGFQNISNVGGTPPPTERMIGNIFW